MAQKQWGDHHYEGLAQAIERLLHAAGCPTVGVHYDEGTHLGALQLSVTIDFTDFEDDTVDGAVLWALGAHKAGGGS